MFRFQSMLGIAILVVAFVTRFGHGQPTPDNKENEVPDSRPIIWVKIDGRKYSAPVYEDVEFTRARRDFDAKSLNKMFEVFREILPLMLENKLKNKISVSTQALGLLPIAHSNTRNLRKLQMTDKSPEMALGYGAKMAKLILDILAVKDVDVIDKAEVMRRGVGLMDAVQAMSEKSRCGLYLDWDKFNIDGQPLIRYAGAVINWLRNNGYGTHLKFFDKLAALVKSTSRTS